MSSPSWRPVSSLSSSNVSPLPVRVNPQAVSHLARRCLHVQEVAVTTARTLRCLVLTTARFPEICDGRQLCVDGLAVVPAVVQTVNCLLSVLFTLKHDIYVTCRGICH